MFDLHRNSLLIYSQLWWGFLPGVLMCLTALVFFVREFLWWVKPWNEPSRLPFNNSQAKTKRYEKTRKTFLSPNADKRSHRHNINHRGPLAPPGKRSKRFDTFLTVVRALVISTADAQSIIALTYAINFGMSGKCTVSAYHFSVGVNTILCACATIILSVIMVRDFWKAFCAALIRFSISISLLAILGRILVYQYFRPLAPEAIGWLPDKRNNTDSSIFVPIACFLDPDLDPFKGLSNVRVEWLGGRAQSKNQPEIYLYILLVLCFLLGHGSHIYRRKDRYGQSASTSQAPKRINGWSILYYFFTLVTCSLVYLMCWGHNWLIRDFVDGSGWIVGGRTNENPERNVNSIGQLLPLVAIGWVVINGLDACRW